MQVPVIFLLEHCSRLDGSHCHIPATLILLLPGPFISHLDHSLAWIGVHVISHLDYCSCRMGDSVIYYLLHYSSLNENPCPMSRGPLLLSGWESLSFLTWTITPAWMRVPVISFLDRCSYLDCIPCHCSPGLLFPPQCEFLSYLTWSTAPTWSQIHVISTRTPSPA